jgi:hypothetical protein
MSAPGGIEPLASMTMRKPDVGRIVDCLCLELVLGELTTAAESDGQKRTDEYVAKPEEDSSEARCRLASVMREIDLSSDRREV